MLALQEHTVSAAQVFREREKKERDAQALEPEEDDHNDPDSAPPPLPRAPAHDGEQRKDDRPDAHQGAVQRDRARAALQRREGDDLEADGREAREREGRADVGFVEACAHATRV